MLLQQGECEPIEPRKILTQELVADAEFILTVDEIEAPVTTVFDRPVTSDRTGKQLHADRQAAEEVASLTGLLPSRTDVSIARPIDWRPFQRSWPGRSAGTGI